MKIRLFVPWTLGLVFISASLFSQGYGRKTKDAFPQQPRFEKKYWYFDLGTNFTFPLLSAKKVEGSRVVDTLYQSNLKQKGNVGATLALGRYHLINNLYFFRYWNYGLSYRWLRGDESYSDEMLVNGNSTNLGGGTNNFSDHYLGAHIEINGRNKLSDHTFLQHSLGLNASYAVKTTRNYTHSVPGIEEKSSDKIHSYLYYRFGFGSRMFKKLIVIPSVEVPILNLFTFNSGKPDMPYFNSSYWPFSFTVRFMLCQPYRMKSCPPVDAIGVPEGYQDQGGEEKK